MKDLDINKAIYSALFILIGMIWANNYGSHLLVFTIMFGILIFSYFDVKGTISLRLKELVFAGFLILILTPFAILSGGNLITILLFTTIIVFLSSMAIAVGPQTTKVAFLLSTWLLIALSIPGSISNALSLTISILFGGLIYLIFILLTSAYKRSDNEKTVNTSFSELRGISNKLKTHLNFNSPVLKFSLLRTIAVLIAIQISWMLFENKPLWTAYAVFFVMRPNLEYLIKPGIERAVGTLIGAVLASITIFLFSDYNMFLQIVFLFSASAIIAEGGKNYFLFISLLTYSIIIYFSIFSDVPVTASERILENLIGIGIALLTIVLLKLWSKRLPIDEHYLIS